MEKYVNSYYVHETSAILITIRILDEYIINKSVKLSVLPTLHYTALPTVVLQRWKVPTEYYNSKAIGG